MPNRPFKITSMRDYNIFDNWPDDWPPKESYVDQFAATPAQYRKFASILKAGASERVIEGFFKSAPEVLILLTSLFSTGHHAAWLYSKRQIRPAFGAVGGLVPDYMLAGASSLGVTWFLLELKGPNQRAFVRHGKRISLTSAANRGVCQLINYIDHAARSQAYLRDELGLEGFREPKGILVIGTDAETKDDQIRAFKGAWNSMNHRVQIRSYSALLREVEAKLRARKEI